MTLPDVPELIWTALNQKLTDQQRQVTTNALRGELAQVAGGIAGLTLANLPLVNNTPGDLYYALDGCKPGEATGHGTGCAVYWDGVQLTWLRVGDYASPSGPGGTLLGVGSGGTGANLSATGGSHQFVRQSGVGAVFTVSALTLADMPAGLAVSPLTTKGDLWTFSTVDARLGVGANNAVLVADSTQTTGNKWSATLAGLTLTSPTINTATISGGTIDNAVIGGGTPAAGTFTALTVSGAGYKDLTVNGSGTVGAGATFNATGTGGRQYTAFSTANGAAAGAGAFAIFDEIASKYRLILSNGGKAQISEGGSALGNYAALGGAIFDHFADVNNSGTSETDLYSDTIPASALGTNGDTLIGRYSGVCAVNTNTKTIKTYFGGSNISFGLLANATTWNIEVRIIRDSSTSVRMVVSLIDVTAGAYGGNLGYLAITGLTLTNSQILKITGQSNTASNDITAKMGKVEWKSAA